MKFAQYYLDCLSQASYLIGDESSGHAVVVDPRRDIEVYLADAHESALEIVYVIETHFHADFLSGHLELADATGAQIIYGSAAETQFPIRRVVTGERIELGPPDGVVLEFRETPGHTPESLSVVIWERAGDPTPYGVLTGDTLFIGDVGRPDLLASVGVTAEDLAGQLYSSLHEQLLSLPDETKVFPAHGAGSACGKNLSTETVSTIGAQRRENYALGLRTVDEFVAAVTEGQPSAPGYFGYDAGMNRSDRRLLDVAPPERLSVQKVLQLQDSGATILDIRDAQDFARGHIAGSLNVGLGGRFAEYAGSVVEPETEVVLVGDPSEYPEAKVRLGRIGFDNVLGGLSPGPSELADHPEVTEHASRLSAAAFERDREDVDPQLIDVRNPGETAAGVIDRAQLIPLARLRDRLDEIDLTRPIVVYCAGGYRSSVAASMLRSLGAQDVSDILGGYGAWTSVGASGET